MPISFPTLLASDDRSVWVFSDGVPSVLVRVDAMSAGRPEAHGVDVGLAPTTGSLETAASALAAADGSVWLSDNHGELYRLAPGASTLERAEQDVPALESLAPDRLVGAKGSLWMSWFPSGPCCVLRLMDLYRVDPTTGEVIATIDGATQVVASGIGFVWAAMNVNPTDALRLVRIDMETYATTQIGVLKFPWADLTVARGAVWASSPGDGTIVRLDPVTGEEIERIRIGGKPRALAAGGGAVWATINGNRTVARYDIDTGRIETIDVGGTPNDLVVTRGSVWVTVFGPSHASP
jgi:streptogramin lyase